RSLKAAIAGKKFNKAEQRLVDVAQSAVDLQARYLPPGDIEVARFHLHTQQLRVDAAADNLAGVTGEVAALEWIRDRLKGVLNPADQSEIDNGLRDLRNAADSENLVTAADHATRLASRLRDLPLK
ncbi:MAG: hypothetical protein ACREN5_13275, partial [Gemmatimonadales bacterium]